MRVINLNRKLKLGILAVILISAIFYLLGKQMPQEDIRNFLIMMGPFGPIAAIFMLLITYVIAPINILPFLVAGYYLFGSNIIILDTVAVIFAFIINFWIARKWGRTAIVKFIGRGALIKIDKLEKEYGIFVLVALRFFQGGLSDFVSYAYGLTPMKFSTYFIVSVLSAVPSQILWYILSKKTNSIESFFAALAVFSTAGIIIFLSGAYLIRKFNYPSRG